MAYVIERKKRIRDDVVFKDGDKELSIFVDLDIESATKRYWKQYETMCIAREKLESDPSSAEKQEAFGTAVVSLTAFIFGEDQAKKLLEFYEGREGEMLTDVLPYLCDVVYPKLKEASEQRAKKVSGFRGRVSKWRR